ncbi:PREDICTED: histone deacetylase 2-like isoform X1 [Camelina sativa]|uniref:Histone deacetylase 2-like isoform X1 n=1 Tax=Camelina sativa TaxID=90675 RepID=A0ABM0T673_CAMSA|nr:PREDICTED: histone deacetylase 2-like isoform X1 [Camelina sativa]
MTDTRVISTWTEFTRNSAVYLLFTFVAIKVYKFLFCCNRTSEMSSFSMATHPEALRRERILNSKLYFDVPLSKVSIIYSSAYNISFLGIEKLHPFDSTKWGRVCKFLVSDGFLEEKSIVEPLEASMTDLLVVHSENYLNSLKSSATVARIAEVPLVAFFPNFLVQQKVLYPFRKQVGGTILAAKLATERGWAINIGGGFHHCTAERGGGFCAFADISLCAHFAFLRLRISRVMIIDLDAHQGNGHETDLGDDNRVYILDMYNPEIYPFDYRARRFIDQKVEVVSGTTTEEYLRKLDDALEVASRNFQPELVIYNAGTDILDGDPLGRLKISPDGITSRDEKVFRFAREKNIPLVMLTSGGYMQSSARVIADSIENLSRQGLIQTRPE